MERARALESDALFVSATEALGLVHLKTELRQWLEICGTIDRSQSPPPSHDDGPSTRRHGS